LPWPHIRAPDTLLEQAGTPHPRRAEIGDLLNTLGDPRPGVGLRPDGLPDIDWVPVPKGKVKLEGVTGSVEVEEAFRIACYPVTWTQYRAFVEDPQGYASEAWWDDLRHEAQPGTQYRRCGNAPADTVSWYDATAFCRWLTARLRERGELSPKAEVRLPTEWEWQQAAIRDNPNNVGTWGPHRDDGQANIWPSGLGRSISVGRYPAGTWKGGPVDMAGNVGSGAGTRKTNRARRRLTPRVIAAWCAAGRGTAAQASPSRCPTSTTTRATAAPRSVFGYVVRPPSPDSLFTGSLITEVLIHCSVGAAKKCRLG